MTALKEMQFFRRMFLPGVLLFVIPGLLRAYFLMPFPGSQDLEAIGAAYLLERSLIFTRILGGVLMIGSLMYAFRSGTLKKRIVVSIVSIVSLVILYFTDFSFSAEEMFKEPRTKSFANVAQSIVDSERVIIGVEHNGVAKAYPINYLGYHHKVQDSVGGMPVLVTYCTMCRTGRVYNPIVDGRHQEFRLVGARHYNAVIEDQTTKSWWYQATGEAAAGPLSGRQLEDLPYTQSTLKSWIEKYPNTLILQPDREFTGEYDELTSYDRTLRVPKDSMGNVPTWQRRSWVVGVDIVTDARAYDWNELAKRRILNDRMGNTNLLIAVEDDTTSFHVWNREVNGKVLEFVIDSPTHLLKDNETGSSWNWQGMCVDGSLKDTLLQPIQAHQEYWHSWKNFHPHTSQWKL